MAETGMGIWYPNNYSAKADVLKDLEKMAESIDLPLMLHEASINSLEADNTTNKTNITDLTADLNETAVELESTKQSLYQTQHHFVVNKSEELRIWDLSAGVHYLDNTAQIYYAGATDMSALFDTDYGFSGGILIVTDATSRGGFTGKAWILLTNGHYYHGEKVNNGFVMFGFTTETDGEFYEYAIEDLDNTKKAVNSLEHNVEFLDQKRTEQAEQIQELQQENALLKEQIPQEQASGEDIMLEDSSNMAFRSFGIRGNYKQETREGYNLLDTTEFEDNTSDGVSLVVNEDGTLELNGTATADTTFRILKTEKSITATGNENIVINKLNGTLEGTVRLICQDNDYGNTVYSQIGTSEFTNKLTADITYNIFSLQVYNGAVCNNLKLGLVISSSKTAYEQYGATPSVKIPSEIETTGENGAVNETVCNKNMFDWESAGMVNKGIDSTTGILMQTTNLTRLANENLIFLKAGAYTISYKLADKLWLWVYNRDKEYQYQYLMQNWVDNITTYTFTVNEDVYLRIILAKTNDGEMPLTDNYEIQLKGEDTATDYVAHESQTVTMPVQQPMVSEEDYFDWENEKEVHGWNKKVFDGTERWRMPKTNEENAVFENLESTVIYDFADDTEKQLSTHFEWKGRKNGYSVALNAGVGMYTLSTNSGYKYVYFVVPLTVASTVEEWKAYLAEQAEAGTPLTNYYIATTPTELDFTTEQKAVKEQIKNLHSYKNVTHIFSTDQVPAIADVTYFKDLETVINNNKQETEARLEAIETLLSTTGTSALLLDNYETDLLEEVEQNA